MLNRGNGAAYAHEKNMMVVYEPAGGKFSCPAEMGALFGVRLDGRPLWQMLVEDGVVSGADAGEMRARILEAASAMEPEYCSGEHILRMADGTRRKYRISIVSPGCGAPVSIVFSDIEPDTAASKPEAREIRHDVLADYLNSGDYEGALERMLREGQFIAYFQPQYNHSTGMLVGAEALARWNHPEQGMITPDRFIPIFEQTGAIALLDIHIFEQTCRFLRRCLDRSLPMAAVSVNFSRRDFFRPDFAEKLESIRNTYGIPVEFLRVEITESALAGSAAEANEVVKKLHQYGYIVEMDDFGSGYSSLNVLKDIEIDMIKLDMLFLSDNGESNRGGTILSSVVRMAKWLGLPVIAEGVETLRQADFLKSIGCDYMQGYFYSRPLPEAEYEKLLERSAVGAAVPQLNLIETLNPANFWDPESLETLIFSNYVGGAAIFAYHEGKVEILRVNKKYLREIGMNHTEKEMMQFDPMGVFDETNRRIYEDMLDRAIRTGEEQECETWRMLSSSCCGDERICIRTNVRMIGDSGETTLFYAMIRNITAEKMHYIEMTDTERRFKMASEQVNIYFWEYTVATREMRPCFRCMRDLGLPALLTNYPDSAIEMGIFPPEVADMYRDWHVQIANGAKELEAIIPLTVGRVPFHVRYTTEFDELGRPIKAYGSAALVVDSGDK